MKNVLISLFALAAISGTAFASDNGNGKGGNGGNRDNGSYIRTPVFTTSSALVIVKKKKLTAFESVNQISENNDRGDNRSDREGLN